jgi:hypothetical protein
MDIFIHNVSEKDYACDALVLPVTEGDSGPYGEVGTSVSRMLKKVLNHPR